MDVVGVVHYTNSPEGDDLAFRVVYSFEECERVIRSLLRVPGVFSAGVTFAKDTSDNEERFYEACENAEA